MVFSAAWTVKTLAIRQGFSRPSLVGLECWKTRVGMLEDTCLLQGSCLIWKQHSTCIRTMGVSLALWYEDMLFDALNALSWMNALTLIPSGNQVGPEESTPAIACLYLTESPGVR